MIDGKGDVLYVGKAKSLKARVGSYARGQAHSNRIARMIAETASMEFVTTATEDRGAAARGQPHQAAAAALQRAAAGRQVAALHPAHRRPRGAAARQASRRAQAQGRLFRALRQRLGGEPHHQRAAARVPAALLQRQLLREPHAALPAVPDQALLRPLHAGDRVPRIMRGLAAEARAFLSGKSNAVKERITARCKPRPRTLEFERAARCRDRLAALSADPGRAGHQHAIGRGGGRLRPRRAGGAVLRRGVLLPQLAELGQPRVFPEGRQVHDAGGSPGVVPGAVLRRQAGAAPDPALARDRGCAN